MAERLENIDYPCVLMSRVVRVSLRFSALPGRYIISPSRPVFRRGGSVTGTRSASYST